ncbi:putative two-component histidine kinase [Streptomyces lydicamycinicus]|uniref:Putative two-component histidine kinase n=1 Tax=Streptomyces lydicamycinicus TaxID=1546107 RepID=A0A0P4R0M6_9ACTN|nr:sensor histidine kinase [Streptomyces lydicamycinicus]GAO06190.1 putative two-component histidine kinase [Streptomyces lydicamycinicus]
MRHTTGKREPADRSPMLIGQPPRNRRQALVKTMWISLWLLYLAGPVSGLLRPGVPTAERIWGGLGLTLFVLCYFGLVFRHIWGERSRSVVHGSLALLLVLSMVLSWTLDSSWLVLFIFTSVGCGVVLPWQLSRWSIPLVTAVLLVVGAHDPQIRGYYLFAYGLPALGCGFLMVGVQHLIHTSRELRAAREKVARLAANDERLRLSRDLHDLLGHSLSLITLKSELAGRMLPDRPSDAARQVADIEQVSRQALLDVREAVTGYRRPRLAVELAGARAALRTAGVTAVVDPALEGEYRGLTADEEGALAWALREAVTNVIRHSGARRCELLLTEEREADERHCLCLTVLDDGTGPPRAQHEGNGLSGLRERLALADGRLETGPAPRGRGFALRARVPLGDAGTEPSPSLRTP